MTQINTDNQANNPPRRPGAESDDDAREELGPWTRWAAMICTSVVAIGTALASPWVLWALSLTAVAGAFLPNHPFDYLYNYGIRHLTGTRPLPPNSPQRKFALAIAAVLLAATGAAFFTDATSVGYGLGIGAKLYVRFVRRPDGLSFFSRAVPGAVRAWTGAG